MDGGTLSKKDSEEINISKYATYTRNSNNLNTGLQNFLLKKGMIIYHDLERRARRREAEENLLIESAAL